MGSFPANISFETEERLSTFKICLGDSAKIIRSLDRNKAHGYDEISLHMIKIYASSISKPLATIYRNYLENKCFHKEWKKANIVPVHKKMIKN